MKLSIIIPAYNEERSITKILDKLLLVNFPVNTNLEILVLNDGSKDQTFKLITDYSNKHNNVYAINNEKNLGKSQTVKKGILMSKGDYVIVQDADLEYDPNDILVLFNEITRNDWDFVYGNRFSGKNKILYKSFFIGNRGISFISNIFTFVRLRKTIPDMEVCYKLVKGNIIRNIAKTLVSKTNFGFEPEITAKLARYKVNSKHLKFVVLPISYNPRSIKEGKKIRWIDGVKAIFEIIKFNLF